MRLRARLSRLLRARRAGPVVLMYHRIARPAADPWGLAVSPENFRSQLRALKQRRVPLAMDDFADRLRSGTLPPRAAALTFDDGYLDNFEVAKPILEEEGVPATVLVTTGWLGSTRLFWWDELSRLILQAPGPIAGEVAFADGPLRFDLGPAEPEEPRRDWRAWEPSRTPREDLYHRLWSRLQRLDDAERDRLVGDLSRTLGEAPASEQDRVMTRDELSGLASPMVTVGVHAVSHRPLTAMPPEARRREIADSRAACETATGLPMTGFAYPHGDLDPPTRDIVAELGFAWAVTTESRGVDPRRFDPLALPRIMAPDLPGDALLAHIQRESA